MGSQSIGRLALFTLLLASPCLASRPAVHSRRLMLALRGGDDAAAPKPKSLLWVKNGTDGTLQLVRSLSKFCAEHELDEEAMLAVSRGESDECDGWTCGEASEYDPPPKKKKKAAAKAAAVQAEEVEDDKAAAEKPPPPKQQMQKMLVGMILPMGVVQVIKSMGHDLKKPDAVFLTYVRGTAFALIAFNLLVQFILDMRIKARNDKTEVKAAFNPLAMLMGGAGADKPQTAAEYDQKQLGQLRNS